MPAMHRLSLDPSDRCALVRLRDTARRPYLRERAAALLKIADGMPAAQVARSGLLRPRGADAVYAWLDRFEQFGLAGLPIRPGRGRKPAFSPSAPHGSGSASERAAHSAT